jgi:hypothetical protein
VRAAQRACHCGAVSPCTSLFDASSLRPSSAPPQGCVLLRYDAARRAGLVDERGIALCSADRGKPVTVRGVVSGAKEVVPTIRITCARVRCAGSGSQARERALCCAVLTPLHARTPRR